jgi:hypothetical protein
MGSSELRLQLLEWLLSVYDPKFFSKCDKEISDRSVRVGKQLFVLGLGGSKLAECEAFVKNCSKEKDNVYVFSELVDLALMAKQNLSEEKIQENFLRDMEFPTKIAEKSDVYFSKNFELFPPDLIEKVNFDEKLDFAELSAQLSALFEKLEQKITAVEAKNKLAKSTTISVDPNRVPDLKSILASFGETVGKFNELYRNEISVWKVTSIKPNVELGNLAAKLREQQKELTVYLESFGKAKRGCSDIGGLESELDVLAFPEGAGPQISNESIMKMRNQIKVIEQ